MLNRKASFKLYQPLFMLTKNYKEFIPRGEHCNSIALFYQFQMPSNRNQLVAVPDGVVDLIFCCDPSKPSAKVVGSVTKGKNLAFQPDTDYFGIRFVPGQSSPYLADPGKDFVEQEILLTDIMRESDRLVENVVYQSNFEDRVRTFINTRFSSAGNTKETPILVQYVMRRINERCGLIRIDELAEETAYSTRYINRTFQAYLGISPKFFCRVVRFQNALELLHSHPAKKTSDLVVELGYFDQAHFINEFKEFSFLTPGQLLQEKPIQLKS